VGLQQLEQLLQEFMQAIQLVMQSGEELSDELQGQLAQTLELLVNRIDQLKQEESPADGLEPQALPKLNEGMPSSNVESFGYDDKSGNLLVRFLGKHPNRMGPVYSYTGVPKNIFELFRKGAIPARTDGKNKWGKWWRGKTPSVGASLFTLIKNGGYSYSRL
jgi:hypothetical protein